MRSTRPPPPPAPPPNAQFGEFTLVDRLAVGGMAEVFRALEPRPVGEPRLVVIKRMLPSIAAQPGARDMFEAEAGMGAMVQHENVVEVLGFGEEEQQPYLALEYVRGVDLYRLTRHLTRNGATLGIDLTLYVVRQMLAGLHAVHEACDAGGRALGIVHRDVSPSNVLLSVHGEIKVGDFGIAYMALREALPNSAFGERAKGKLGYLAPEQVVGGECDRRTDVFSAGVIAAELLMGRPLFAGGSELAVLLAIRDAKIHPFLEVAGELPSGLGETIIEALAREPESRLATASEMWARLGPFCTVPDDELRPQLATLVGEALRELAEEAAQEPTPLREVAQGDRLSQSDIRTPVRAVESLTPTRPSRGLTPVRDVRPNAGDHGPVGTLGANGPPTADLPVIEYRVRTTEGIEHGPWSYAKVVEAVAIGRLGPADEVSDPSGAFNRIADIPTLSRHLPPSTQRRTPTGGHVDAPQEPDEMVPLSYGGVISALALTALRRDTGLWLCEAGDIRKEIYVKDGVPEFVTSNLAGELLGEYLVAKSVITRGELDMALAVMPRFEGRLGDTLAALGLVEPVHLFQHIAGQVRDKLLDLFLWTGGHAALYRGVPPPSSGFPLGLDPWKIIDEGVGKRLEMGLEAERFDGNEERSLRLSPRPPAEVVNGVLPTDARIVLTALENPRGFDDLATAFHSETTDRHARLRRTVVLLMQLGAVEWAD